MVPGLFFNLGELPKGKDVKDSAPHHTPEFFVDDASMITGLKALSTLVVDYMEMSKK